MCNHKHTVWYIVQRRVSYRAELESRPSFPLMIFSLPESVCIYRHMYTHRYGCVYVRVCMLVCMCMCMCGGVYTRSSQFIFWELPLLRYKLSSYDFYGFQLTVAFH